MAREAKTPGVATRRDFLVGAGVCALGTALAAGTPSVEGRLADVTPPGVPPRKGALLPPGAVSPAHYLRACLGCQLCVAACPNGVLRPGDVGARPVMGFERGWCRPECTVCGAVCPTGALRPLSVLAKRGVRVGVATWQRTRCVRVQEGENCDLCVRKCPVHAITLVPTVPSVSKSSVSQGTTNSSDLKSPVVQVPKLKLPHVDASICMGCGACENLCPSRPLPALVVDPPPSTKH